MSDAALCALLRLPYPCFSDTFLPALSLLRRFPRPSALRFPLCEDFLAARPAFSRVGSYTGLRFCVAPSDDTLCASLCLPCPYFSSKFSPVVSPSKEISPSVHPALSLLRRFPRRFIWRFPSVKILPPPARLFPCWKLHRPALLRCAPGQYPARLALPSMFMLLKQILARRFPFCGDFPVGSSGASPSVKVPLPAARLFPVSEAAPVCASALRPRTILCAPRFAFHVHTFQANSLPSGRPA